MKKLFIMVFTVMALLSSSVCVIRTEAANISITEDGDNGIVVYADEIEYRYRDYNGRAQYRRWNVTRKCWVDKYWIYV